MSDYMGSTLPNMQPINSESASINVNDGQEDQEYSGFPPLPKATPTDYSKLFKSELNSHRHKLGYIRRPPNAFLLFRSDLIEQWDFLRDLVNDHRELSKFAGVVWRKMSDNQKKPWFEKAEEARHYHSKVYPGYRYSPTVTGRPKRVYRKRKHSLSLEEILLRRPHEQLESSPSTTQDAAPPQVLSASSASETRFSPLVSCIGSSTSSTNWQDPVFPGNHAYYPYDYSGSQLNHALDSGPPPLPSPQAYSSGYIDDSGHCPDTVPNRYDYLQFNAHYDGGYWQNSVVIRSFLIAQMELN